MTQRRLARWQKHWNLKIKQNYFWDMQSAAKLRRDSSPAYQISPTPILDTNEYAKKEVGGRGGAYKFTTIDRPLMLCIYTSTEPIVDQSLEQKHTVLTMFDPRIHDCELSLVRVTLKTQAPQLRVPRMHATKWAWIHVLQNQGRPDRVTHTWRIPTQTSPYHICTYMYIYICIHVYIICTYIHKHLYMYIYFYWSPIDAIHVHQHWTSPESPTGADTYLFVYVRPAHARLW